MEKAWKTYRRLPIHWKTLIACFVLSCVIMFVMSLQLVSRAQTCATDSCVLTALDIFIRVSLSLIVLCMVAIVYFLMAFFWHQAKTEKRPVPRKPKRQ